LHLDQIPNLNQA